MNQWNHEGWYIPISVFKPESHRCEFQVHILHLISMWSRQEPILNLMGNHLLWCSRWDTNSPLPALRWCEENALLPPRQRYTLSWACVLSGWQPVADLLQVTWISVGVSYQFLSLLNASQVYSIHGTLFLSVCVFTLNKTIKHDRSRIPHPWLNRGLLILSDDTSFSLCGFSGPRSCSLTHMHTPCTQVAKATHESLGWMKGRGGWDHWCLVSLLRYRSPQLPLTARRVNEVRPAVKLKGPVPKKIPV